MSEVSVKDFAKVINTPVQSLIEQLAAAGVENKVAESLISDDEKSALLGYLRRAHKAGATDASGKPARVTLERREVKQLSQRGAGAGRTPTGRARPTTRKVNVVVRKKRTYVKRSQLQDESAPAEEAIEPTELPTDTPEAAIVPADASVAAPAVEDKPPVVEDKSVVSAPAAGESAPAPKSISKPEPAAVVPLSPESTEADAGRTKKATKSKEKERRRDQKVEVRQVRAARRKLRPAPTRSQPTWLKKCQSRRQR